jgi:hypothetical protein
MTADLDVTATFVVPLNCGAATTTIATCPNGTVAEVTPTAASAGACRTQCATQMAAKEMASGCWYFQNNTCHCRSGQATTGTTLTGGSCS